MRQLEAAEEGILVDVAPGTQPHAFAKTLIINGKKLVIEAPDEAQLARRELEAYKIASAAQQTDDNQPAPRDAAGRFRKETPADDPTKQKNRRSPQDFSKSNSGTVPSQVPNILSAAEPLPRQSNQN